MSRPIRVLELRCVYGTGGGPDKTILVGASLADPSRFAITVCYLRNQHDPEYGITDRLGGLSVDYVELQERHFCDWRVLSAIRDLVRQRAIDIVHAHDYKTDLIALILARTNGVIPLATVHGWTGHSARERLLYYPCDKRLLARYPRLIAVSDEIRGELVRRGADSARITTILNGIDPDEFRRDRAREVEVRRSLGFGPDDLVVGAVGRLEPQKRFDVLLEAAAILKPQLPSLKLLIVGDGSQAEALRSLAGRLGLDGTCRFTGHVTDIASVHHAFNLFVQSSDYEGTPNAVLEAMALETPLVATDAGGTRELFTSGIHGLLVGCGDPQRLAEAIHSMAMNRGMSEMMARAARARVESELSFRRRMQRVEEIYCELVPDASGRTLQLDKATVTYEPT